MNRHDAYNLVCEFTDSDSLRKRMLAVEAAMRAYAKRCGEDEDKWGIVGLLHDFDYEKWPNPRPTIRSKVLPFWPNVAIRPM